MYENPSTQWLFNEFINTTKRCGVVDVLFMQSLIEIRGIIETGNETVARAMLPLIQEEITRAERVNLNLALLLLPALEKQWPRRECRK